MSQPDEKKNDELGSVMQMLQVRAQAISLHHELLECVEADDKIDDVQAVFSGAAEEAMTTIEDVRSGTMVMVLASIIASHGIRIQVECEQDLADDSTEDDRTLFRQAFASAVGGIINQLMHTGFTQQTEDGQALADVFVRDIFAKKEAQADDQST